MILHNLPLRHVLHSNYSLIGRSTFKKTNLDKDMKKRVKDMY